MRSKITEPSLYPELCQELREQMFLFEDLYFKDMTLNEKRLQNKLMKVHTKEGGKWVSDFNDDESFHYLLNHWVVVYSDSQNRLKEGQEGQCRDKQKRIVIRKHKDRKEERNTLLHEMIHAYEFTLPEVRRQYLLLYIYKKLLKKIDTRRLENILDLDSHVNLIVHSPLFLFKSLDLDLRSKQVLGTIYSYGRKKFFK